MGLTVIAEEINSARMLELFRRHGCRLFKGREVAPLLHANEVLGYLEDHARRFGAMPNSCSEEEIKLP